jgi:hypothetical protein
MITTIGFDCTAMGIDPAHSRSQVYLDVMISVKRLIMDQKSGLVRTLQKKFF